MFQICVEIGLSIMKVIKENELPLSKDNDNHILSCHCMGKLKDISKHQKEKIQHVTELTKNVVEKFTIVLAKDISHINDFILQMKGSMKTTLDNHIDCIIGSDSVLLPTILDIFEKYEILENISPRECTKGQTRKRKNLLKTKSHLKLKSFFLFYFHVI